MSHNYSSTSNTTLPIPSTTTMDCYDVDPPRKNGESWKVDNCTNSTCINGEVTTKSASCAEATEPICVNGHKAVKIYEDNGCCFKYECDCVCSVLEGSNYMTFDGKSYTFNESCSYYLVKEIINKYNLTIIVNNNDKALTVIYKSTTVHVNGKRIFPAYSNSVLQLTNTLKAMTLEIPEIDTTVVYRTSSFKIDIPSSLFGGNTEGQCGGKLPGLCRPVASPRHTLCHPHNSTPNNPHNSTPNNPSASFNNWPNNHDHPNITHNSTHNLSASFNNPMHTCHLYNEKYQAGSGTANRTQEGCYCPEGTTLFNTVYDTCVPSCGCVGPDGKPKQPNDTWTVECKECVCDMDSLSVECKSIECPAIQSPNCSETGQQLVRKTENCCPTESCECNVTLCPPPMTCPLGLILNETEGTCCKSYSCVPEGVCIYNMTKFKECYCGPEMDPVTKLNIATCTPVVCETNCSEGYEYETAIDKCCGQCVQKRCIFTTPDNTTRVIDVGETFVSPDDKCVKYTCENINGDLVTKETKTTCPAYNPLDCEPGTETTDADGCCKSCKVRSVCEVQKKETVIEVNGCKGTVNLTSCAGHCGSSSIYSAEANEMMHQCECCQEENTSYQQMELTCADGSKALHAYIMVETCRCKKADCVPGTQRRRRR
ncbi:Intestinal mucin-like protein [Collichthys lucidus]|uniref:Intestinal mucin-like protein n=1 Tax=Collichthys lucidus TaxID=240159 RepID=A0A4U5U839_COLLU|nr:Intestinal mucin-like protein [Collichthys lucidus]